MMSQHGNEREQLLNAFGEFVYVADIHTYELLYMNERCLNFLNLSPENYKHKKCYEKGTPRHSRGFFICACKAFLPAAP